YAEADEATDRLTAVLAARGVSRGARVVWWGETTLDAIPLYFALVHLGAVLGRTDPALVVTDDHHAGDAVLTELLAERPPSVVDVPAIEEHDAHVVFFTSGTTGQPKGVVLSQRTQRLRMQPGAWPVGPRV